MGAARLFVMIAGRTRNRASMKRRRVATPRAGPDPDGMSSHRLVSTSRPASGSAGPCRMGCRRCPACCTAQACRGRQPGLPTSRRTLGQEACKKSRGHAGSGCGWRGSKPGCGWSRDNVAGSGDVILTFSGAAREGSMLTQQRGGLELVRANRRRPRQRLDRSDVGVSAGRARSGSSLPPAHEQTSPARSARWGETPLPRSLRRRCACSGPSSCANRPQRCELPHASGAPSVSDTLPRSRSKRARVGFPAPGACG